MPNVSLTPATLGWMAAIIDLKGILLRKKNQSRATPQLVMVVDSKNFAVIGRLAELTGTQPEAKRVQDVKAEWLRRGCTEHCPEAHVHVHDNWHMPETQRWSTTGVAAAVVLTGLRPYLISDKPYDDFIEEALRNAALTGQGSGAVKATISRLVSLGWALPSELAQDLLSLSAIAAQVKAQTVA
jgi:hypothetical protein